jgi:hypothetical protein
MGMREVAVLRIMKLQRKSNFPVDLVISCTCTLAIQKLAIHSVLVNNLCKGSNWLVPNLLLFC